MVGSGMSNTIFTTIGAEMKNARNIQLPRVGESLVRSVRFSPPLWARLLKEAKKNGRTINGELIQSLLEKYNMQPR
jgi:hypothetical protein